MEILQGMEILLSGGTCQPQDALEEVEVSPSFSCMLEGCLLVKQFVRASV